MAWPERWGIGFFVLMLPVSWFLNGGMNGSWEMILGLAGVVAALVWLACRTLKFMFGG